IERVHPQDRDPLRQLFKDHAEGKTPIFRAKMRYQMPDSNYRWFLLRGRAQYDAAGRALRMVGSASDITSEQVAQDAVSERQMQLDAVFNLSSDAFVVFDGALRVSYVNPAFFTVTGIQQVAVLGLDEEQFYDAMKIVSDHQRPFPTFASLRASASGDARGEALLVDLLPPWNRVLRVNIRDGQHPAISQVLYLRDVTEATRLDVMKSEFLATAAHELRTPMTNVMGFAELLAMQGGELPETERNEFHHIILGQTRRMADILNELLDLARIEARRGKDFTIERIQLQALVQDLVAGFPVPSGRQAPINDLPELYCRADVGKLRQVLLNILSNAYKYSAEQGGSVRIAQAPPLPQQAQVLVGLVITDQGIGMTDEQLGHVFERFFRAHKS
ncbi:MAG: histidine kinase dimerization/phospho-acceptor domain-containing protein, partial [Rhodoferax sp.]